LILPADPEDSKQLPAPKRAARKPKVMDKPLPIRRNGLRFNIPLQGEALPEKSQHAAKPKAERVKRPCDPRLVAAARELRDRWLEMVNADPSVLLSAGKYDVSRLLQGPRMPADSSALPAPLAA
jgi:hypothetical protein